MCIVHLQLWADKECKQKLSKVNYKVYMYNLTLYACTCTCIYNVLVCVCACVLPWSCGVLMLQALSTLRQKVRKYNKDFEADIQSFRENPVNSDEEPAQLGTVAVPITLA